MSATLLPWAVSVFCRAAIESGHRRLREPRANTVAGSSESWDSYGGSFSRESIMGMRQQQWPWFAILSNGQRKNNDVASGKLRLPVLLAGQQVQAAVV